jgi:hypothetical protein
MIYVKFGWAVFAVVLCQWSTVNAADDEKSATPAATASQSDEPKDAAKADGVKSDSPALKAMRELAGKCSFQVIGADSKPALEVRKEPLLKYTDEAIDVAASTLWVWMDGEIPALFQKIEVNNRGGGSMWTYCFANANSSPVECGWSEGRKTVVTAEPVLTSPVPGNPEVKETPAALSFTARQISRQFSASDGTELRLMPRPLMEFKAEKQNVPYGAVFAYATGTNPSMLLILQIEETPAGKRWMYRPVHMTAVELTLNHDGKSAWKGAPQKPNEVSTWGYFFTFRNAAIK